MLRGLAVVGVLLVVCGGSSAAGTPAHRAPPSSSWTAAGVVYSPPVPLHVVRGFSPPRTQYGAGHLGVDLNATSSQLVRTAAAGTVTFAGPVVDRGVVVVTHADGIRTEYEPLRPAVHVGEHVRAGQALGRVAGTHRGCAAACLHWGARRGETYLDPLSLLGGLGPVRLLPWHRSPS